MIVTDSFMISMRVNPAMWVSHMAQRGCARLGAVFTAPVFCLGLSLLGLVPLLLG